jgi:hypothetical protein
MFHKYEESTVTVKDILHLPLALQQSMHLFS